MTNLSKAERAKYDMVIGSRRQVYNGTAPHTSGGLTKSKLFMTKNGRIVSKSKHLSAKKEKRLVKHGYGTKKGKFGFVLLKGHKKSKKANKSKKSKKTKKSKKSLKKKGGYSGHLPLSPENYDGKGVVTSGVALQEVDGQAGGKNRRKKGKKSRRKRGGECPDGGVSC